MRLRTKLVLTAGGLTFAVVLVLSIIFLGELLHQRVENTYDSNETLARAVRLAAIQAVETGLRAHPPDPNTADPHEAFHAAVVDALSSNEDLVSAMNAIIRSSLDVQDVSISDAQGITLLSTDPDAISQRAPYRTRFSAMLSGSVLDQARELFGRPHVLDISEDIERNQAPFLVVHIGVRTTFLSYAYKPWLSAALEFALLATIASAVVAALLSAVALRPMQSISEQLERLTLSREETTGSVVMEQPLMLDTRTGGEGDPIGRVTRSIDRLGRELRSREEGYTALQANLNQMLDTLRDGVLLFAPEGRAVMVSDAVAHFLSGPAGPPSEDMVGMFIEQIFLPGTALGDAVLGAFRSGTHVSAETVVLEDGRQVQISLDRIGDSAGSTQAGAADRGLGTLLTLRDTGSARELEQELEVSRRLAAIGRLTANVGHEVKNPINAMVVHLELLRGKLAGGSADAQSAQKHVEILSDEMHRLDRVVQTLADFSRPMDLELRDHDLRRVVEQTLELAGAELKEHGVAVESSAPVAPVPVRVDAELVRQALLNLLLNAMQAMPEGGLVRITARRDQRAAIVEIADNGVGIPESLLPRIFDLYFTTKPRGSGIGLAMTYRILQLHGGSLEVRSNADPVSQSRGTTFTLQIPLSTTSPADLRKSPGQLADGGMNNGAATALAAVSDQTGPSTK